MSIHPKIRLCSTIALILLLVGLVQNNANAFTDQDDMSWIASADAPLTFTVPLSQGSAIMGKAQGLISSWVIIHGVELVSEMKIETVTDSLIQTYNPEYLGDLGFTVTCTVTGSNDEISVNSLYQSDGAMKGTDASFAGTDLNTMYVNDAGHAAHFLAYLLQQYAATLPTPQSVTASAPTASTAAISDTAISKPVLPDDLEPYLKLIRTQLANQQYQTALSTINALKSAITDKIKPIKGAVTAAHSTQSKKPVTASH
jgi:hypothetical protein